MIVKEKREEFLSYLEDTSNLKGEADTLFIPESKEEIREILRDCCKRKIPLTCSGARTGTTGGCVPLEGAILSLEKLNRLKGIDAENRVVRVEAGLSFQGLEEETNRFGLSFRASPTETLAFVGASVSTCASGVRGFRYGSIRDYIKGIEIILANGTVLNINRGEIFSRGREFSFSSAEREFNFSLPTYNLPPVKTQAGYFVRDNMDLIDLFIGSEGTLGVIVEIDLALQSISKDIFDSVVFFEKEIEGLNFAKNIKNLKGDGRFFPTSLEFFDAHSLEFLRQEYPHIPAGECAVYFEQEVEDQDLDGLMNIWVETIESSGASLDRVWFGDAEKERGKIYEFRHKLPQLINEFLREYNQRKLSTDIAVPFQNFREMYEFYKKGANGAGVYFVNFGHIGENHLHFNFLPKNDEEYKKAKQTILEFIKKAISLGGTVSAEHGIGKIKRPYLEMMYGRRHIEEMASLKRYFDENFILGRDNLIDFD